MTLLMPAHYASRSTLYLHHTYWGYYHSLDIGVSLSRYDIAYAGTLCFSFYTVSSSHLLGLLPQFRYWCLSQDMTLLMPAHYASRSTLYLHHTYWGYYHSLDIGISLKI